MKKSVQIVPAVLLAGWFFCGNVFAQPEFRSDVQKEYDENGNIIRYDSCWSWSNHDFHFNPDQLGSLFDSARYFHFNFPEHFFNEEQLSDLEERFSDFFENHSFPDLNGFFEGHALQDLNELFEHHRFPEPGEFFRGYNFPDMDEFLEKNSFPDLEELFGGNSFPDFENFFHGDSIRLYKRDWQSPDEGQEKSPPGIEI
jgi:hypothetical protein